ncbi:MAG TPA: hypothetical protein VLU43_03590 [Anaeromyxobacteraceae bacterium]|nr:hypothetical protein [Anaeromyxobacteraceae bacterium]
MNRRLNVAAAAFLTLAACTRTETVLSSDPCATGDVYQRVCGNCGTEQRTCVDGAWGDWSGCAGEGACAPGAVDSRTCGSNVGACVEGTSTRSCSTSCAWGAWSACGGAYVGPTPDVCGDGIDQNCNGVPDEGCECAPSAPGESGSFTLAGQIVKLAKSANGCLLYALNAGSPSQVVVIDTKTKQEVARTTLPQLSTDLDLSPNGQHLVVAHDAVHQISLVDPVSYGVTTTIPVASDPYRIEVDDTGLVYYVEYDQWVDLRRVDPSAGIASDRLLASWALYAGDIELSSDGAFLYAGEAGISGGNLYKYDVSGGGFTRVDVSTWDGGYGFPYPVRWVYVAPGGRHVYYAGFQLDGSNLALATGAVGGRVFAEDAAGTFAVGEAGLFDAATLRPIATLSPAPSAAVLGSGDRELWWYSGATGRIYFADLQATLTGVELGNRSLPPAPIASYAIARLVADPVRPRLYGLDTTHGLVVAIDSATLAPTGAILVGSTPTDLAVSLDGASLWIGHLDTLALARIDLASWTFDRFVPTPRVCYEVEALTGGRLAVIDQDQWTTPAIIDGATGAVLDTAWGFYEGALAATGDGATLFVGESYLSGSNLTRYDVSAGTLSEVGKTTYDGGYGFPYPARNVVATPDGQAVYYAGYLLDGSDLSVLRYQQTDAIRSSLPDALRATSSTAVYRVSDGARLGTLPVGGTVQAPSPDGKWLYIATGAAIARVDLSAF